MAKSNMLLSAGWSTHGCPEPINQWPARRRRTDVPQNDYLSLEGNIVTASISDSVVTLHGGICRAAIAIAQGRDCDEPLSVVRLSDNEFIAEQKLSDGMFMLAKYHAKNGSMSAAIVAANGDIKEVPPVRKDVAGLDFLVLYGLLVAAAQYASPSAKHDIERIESNYGDWESCQGAFYRLSDYIYYGDQCDDSPWKIKSLIKQTGKLESLTRMEITNIKRGTILCGTPEYIGTPEPALAAGVTFGEAKEQFAQYASGREWTAEEELFIPKIPDDFMVPPEVLTFARMATATKKSAHPFCNFMWRGTTGYGKSKGVEVMAALLNMPLLKMTCDPKMTTQSFLTDFVPREDNVSPVTSVAMDELPSFREIELDPVSAYEKITGEIKSDIDSEQCFTVYKAAVAAIAAKDASAGQRMPGFKRVESNYVKALAQGYMVEIQEVSRIREPGTLVGLNEFDHPGAVIPMVDGSFKRRHPDAICFFTDNVGYASCRPLDPSVIRRIAFIIDSYELPKETALARIKANTGFADDFTLAKMYGIWETVRSFCEDHDINDGSCSIVELENWVQCYMVDNCSDILTSCRNCLVAKATSDKEEQDAIMAIIISTETTI